VGNNKTLQLHEGTQKVHIIHRTSTTSFFSKLFFFVLQYKISEDLVGDNKTLQLHEGTQKVHIIHLFKNRTSTTLLFFGNQILVFYSTKFQRIWWATIRRCSEGAQKVHIISVFQKKNVCRISLFWKPYFFVLQYKISEEFVGKINKALQLYESTQKVDIISVFQKQFLNLIFCSHYKTSEEFVGKINKALQLYEGTQKDHSIH